VGRELFIPLLPSPNSQILLLKNLRLCRNPRHKIRLSYCREKVFVTTLWPIAEYTANSFPAPDGSKGITH